MKNLRSLFVLFILSLLLASCHSYVGDGGEMFENEENEQDGMEQAMRQEFLMTKDPNLQRIPNERLMAAKDYIKQHNVLSRSAAGMSWTERGPNNIGGRTRAILVDANDPTGNTVFAGSVGGGIWKCTNFKSASYSWAKVNDNMENLAITALAQDPSNPAIMYAGTGEGYYNLDAIKGGGIFKSTNGGASWSPLAQTIPTSSNTDFDYVQDIVVTSVGYVYATTKGYFCNRGGTWKSTNGGTNWTRVIGTYNGSGSCTDAKYFTGNDLEIAANGDLYATTGLMGGDVATYGHIFRSAATLGANQGDAGQWSEITPTPPVGQAGFRRIELAVAPTSSATLYALCQSADGYNVSQFYKSTNSGASWTPVTPPTWCDQGSVSTDFTRGQAWYDLIAAFDPNNANNLWIGGVDCMKSTNGGTTFTQATQWSGGCGSVPVVHADNHNIVFMSGSSSNMIISNDGGIYYSADGGATFSTRNNGYNVTQYYAVAINPTAGSNYMLAGAQDNGTHRLNAAGLSGGTSVTGGDGAFCFIDQLDPTYQITSYVYSNYYISRNGGASFSASVSDNSGQFINPGEYDSKAKLLYTCRGTATVGRLINIVSGTPTFQSISVTGLTSTVSALKIDTNTDNRLYVGDAGGKLVRVDNANTTAPTFTTLTITGASGYLSSIDVEIGNANHLLTTFSNYGVVSVFESTNGGASWTNIEGNLPDMPVRWGVFLNSPIGRIALATELGIWTTSTAIGTTPVWAADNAGLANVRVDMIKIRSSDNTMAIATHGRGVYTASLSSACDVIIQSATTAFCSNSTIPLSVSNPVAGATYTWKRNGVVVSNGTTYNATDTGTYTATVVSGSCSSVSNAIVLTRSVSVTASASNTLICKGGTVTLNANAVKNGNSTTYCIPTYGIGTGAGDFISLVNINGTTLNNATGGSAAPYYTVYPQSGSTTATLTAGTSYTMQVKGGTYQTCLIRGWLDLNGDGQFSSTESIGVSPNVGNSTVGSISFTIPVTAKNGAMRLRLRSSDTSPGPGTGDACNATNSSYGEDEDYIITLTGGAPEFTYSWTESPAGSTLSSNNQSSVTASNIQTNKTYTVTVTDNNGCQATSSVTVGVDSVVVSATAIPAAICLGQSTKLNGVVPNVENFVNYYNPANWQTIDAAGGSVNTSNIPFSISIVSGDVGSNGYTQYRSPVVPSFGSVTFDWSYTTQDGANWDRPVYFIDSTAYPITGFDSASSAPKSQSGTQTISVPPGHTFSLGMYTVDGFGGGATTVFSDLTAPPAASIYWYTAATNGTLIGTSLSGEDFAFTPASEGVKSYYAEGVNNRGCTSNPRAAVSVTVNSNSKIDSIVAGKNPICTGSTTTLTAVGVAGLNYIINWFNGPDTGATFLGTGTTLPNVGVGTYYARVTSECGNMVQKSIKITAVALPVTPTITSVPAASTALCPGSTITLTSSSANGYLWSTGDTSRSINVNTAGSYTVTVYNSAGCAKTSAARTVSYSCPAPASPATTAITASSAVLKWKKVSCASGYQLIYRKYGAVDSTIVPLSDTSYPLGGLTPSTKYQWRVISVCGSTLSASTATITFTTLVAPKPNLGPDTTVYVCPGTTRSLKTVYNISSYSTVVWNPNRPDSAGPGSYTLIVTNSYGKKDTAVITVAERPVMNPVINPAGPFTMCTGDSIILSVLNGPYATYKWSNGPTTATDVVKMFGSISVTVKDVYGCSKTSNAVVVNNTTPTPIITTNPSPALNLCPNTPVTLTASPASNYSWSTGETTQSITKTTAGSYTVTVANGNCTATSAITRVTYLSCGNPLSPTVSYVSGSTAMLSWRKNACANYYEVQYRKSGTTAFTTVTTADTVYIVTGLTSNTSYEWRVRTVCTTSPLSVSGYTALVTFTTNQTVTSKPNVGNDTTVYVCPAAVRSLANVYDLTPYPFVAYSTPNPDAAGKGVYSIVVTDNYGKKDTAVVTVSERPAMNPAISPAGPVSLCAGDTIWFSVLNGPYSAQQWSTGATTQSIPVTSGGTYGVTVADQYGCTKAANPVQVNAVALPSVPTITTNPATTLNLCPNTVVTYTSSAATAYQWSTGETTQSMTKTVAGSYSVKVFNNSGCSNTSAVKRTTYLSCGTPLNPTISGITPTSAVASWRKVNCAVSYELQYRRTQTSAFKTISLTDTTYKIDSLQPFSGYEWRVRAICSTSPVTVSGYTTLGNFTTSGGTSTPFARGTYEQEVAGQGFKAVIYPNPANNLATLQVAGNVREYTITLTSPDGKLLWQSQKFNKGAVQLPVADKPAGVYMITVDTGTEKKILKLVIER